MGNSTKIAMFNSYFDITRGYLRCLTLHRGCYKWVDSSFSDRNAGARYVDVKEFNRYLSDPESNVYHMNRRC